MSVDFHRCGYRGCANAVDPGYDGMCWSCWMRDIEWMGRNAWWYNRLDGLYYWLLKRGIRTPLGRIIERIRWGGGA